MPRIEYKSEHIDHILSLILNDINTLKKNNIDDARIAVSIPSTIKNSIDLYKEKMDSRIEIQKSLFGVEVVPGYNNQICVFDKMAQLNDTFIEPIELIIN